MFIYICCSGGATSSMLAQKTADASKKKAKIGYILELLKELDHHLLENEIVLAYGPVDFVKEMNIKETNLENKINCILIAPQVRFMFPEIKKYYEKFNVPVETIDMRTVGLLDGEKLWKDIHRLIESK